MKESGPLGGRMPGAPPRSANAICIYVREMRGSCNSHEVVIIIIAIFIAIR